MPQTFQIIVFKTSSALPALIAQKLEDVTGFLLSGLPRESNVRRRNTDQSTGTYYQLVTGHGTP
jgi:hypothetical protein